MRLANVMPISVCTALAALLFGCGHLTDSLQSEPSLVPAADLEARLSSAVHPEGFNYRIEADDWTITLSSSAFETLSSYAHTLGIREHEPLYSATGRRPFDIVLSVRVKSRPLSFDPYVVLLSGVGASARLRPQAVYQSNCRYVPIDLATREWDTSRKLRIGQQLLVTPEDVPGNCTFLVYDIETPSPSSQYSLALGPAFGNKVVFFSPRRVKSMTSR